MKSASMQDVAQRAGVSLATVSLVLSGKGRISEKTQQRVRKAVEELDYAVNPSARAIRTDRNQSVGLYIPDYAGDLEFYLSLLMGVTQAARLRDHSVVLVAPNTIHNNISSFAVDGFIMVDVDPRDEIALDILANPKPVIVGEAIEPGIPSPTRSVEFDHARCTRKILNHLWEQGARNVALIGASANQRWSIAVDEEYLRWCQEKSVRPIATGIDFSYNASMLVQLTQELIRNNPEIDAFLSVPESAAAAIVTGVNSTGRIPGEDVLIATYIDGRFAAWSSPSITALDFQPKDFGRRLFESFWEHISAPEKNLKSTFVEESAVPLVVRDSTKLGLSSSSGR
jgi:DNA-binding LacI/PurR family transcriptional regulator